MNPDLVLSIGALAKATGVPVETLRTWERRYGFPAPVERVGTEHRRYSIEAVERLRLAVRALKAGHQPSIVLPASVDSLNELLALGGDASPSPAPRRVEGSFVERCLHHTTTLDTLALVDELARAWSEVGPIPSLTGCIGPFLRALGEAWSRGDVEVGHEHFASEHVREFLVSKWRPASARATGPLIVCATPSGERHVLGLHMAAAAFALSGARIVFLGADTPHAEVGLIVEQQKGAAVALSAAAGIARATLLREVRALRKEIPKRIPILAGGAGFEPLPPGVVDARDLSNAPELVRGLQRPRG